jgi:hypothetical protein
MDANEIPIFAFIRGYKITIFFAVFASFRGDFFFLEPASAANRDFGVGFRPEGPWELSPGFSLGGVTINATSPEGAEEIVI